MDSLGPSALLQVELAARILFFLRLCNIPLYKYCIFTHSSVEGPLGRFHVLAMVNCAAVNIVVHVSF